MKRLTLSALTLLVVALGFSYPAHAVDFGSTSVVDQLALDSYNKRKAAIDIANQAARSKGLTLEALGKACKLMTIRIGAVLTGQAPLEKKSQECLEGQLGVKKGALGPLTAPPARWELGSIYRLHEAVEVYGPAIQRWMNEHFGDAIMSAIDFVVHVEEGKGSHGEKRILITFDGKALPYSNDEGWAETHQ